jgi:hypothetical protein
MAELGQQTVSLSELVKITAQKSYMALEEVVNNAPQQSDTEKKTSLLKYIHDTRQRLLRLHAVTEWCKQQVINPTLKPSSLICFLCLFSKAINRVSRFIGGAWTLRCHLTNFDASNTN